MAATIADAMYQDTQGPNPQTALLPEVNGGNENQLILYQERVVPLTFFKALVLCICFIMPSLGIIVVTSLNGLLYYFISLNIFGCHIFIMPI